VLKGKKSEKKRFTYEQGKLELMLRVIGSGLYKGCLIIAGSQLSHVCMYGDFIEHCLDKVVVLGLRLIPEKTMIEINWNGWFKNVKRVSEGGGGGAGRGTTGTRESVKRGRITWPWPLPFHISLTTPPVTAPPSLSTFLFPIIRIFIH